MSGRLLRPRAHASAVPQVAPVVVPPSQEFDGNDGRWSTFFITVGTPPQSFRVLPATNGQETWVPIPQGCELVGELSNCGDKRGIQISNGSQGLGFDYNASTTYQQMSPGIWDLLMEQNLGIGDSALYGYDSVGIGSALNRQSFSAPMLSHQLVAGLATPNYWLGFFPLSPKASNFTTVIPSIMSNLANQSMIPSLSFGYAAGAQYQDKGAVGSLILGGYDSSKAAPGNNMTFPFSNDDTRSLTVGLQSITAQRTLQGTVAPLASGILALIDSGVPDIWLPAAACAIFQQAFGLTYDSQKNRYLVNDTVHTQLKNLNSSLTFSLGNQASGGSTTSIELPYAAFDLQASWPIYNTTTNYFPLRQAANDTQYTLGRTFLQEAYLVVDYERQNFSISQAIFSETSQTQIVTIRPINDTLTPSASSSSHHLSSNAIAGITIATTATFFVLALLAYYFYRRRRHSRNSKIEVLSPEPQTEPNPFDDDPLAATPPPILRRNGKYEMATATPVPPHHPQNVSPEHRYAGQQPALDHQDTRRLLDQGSPSSLDPQETTMTSNHTYATTTTGMSSLHRGPPPNRDDIISPLSSTDTRTTNELETPTGPLRPVLPPMRQELSGSATAAEAHTSVWGVENLIRTDRNAPTVTHDYNPENSSSSSSSGTRSRSESDTSGGGASIGLATMSPIYELSGETQAPPRVRVKPIFNHYRGGW